MSVAAARDRRPLSDPPVVKHMKNDTPQPRSLMTGRFETKTTPERLTTLSFKVDGTTAEKLRQKAAEMQVSLSTMLRLLSTQMLGTELLDLPPTPAALRAQDLWEPKPTPEPPKAEPPPPEPPKVEPMEAMFNAMAAQQQELTRALVQLASGTRNELPPVQAVNLPPLEVTASMKPPAGWRDQVLRFLQDEWHADRTIDMEVRPAAKRVFVTTNNPRVLWERMLKALPWVTKEKVWMHSTRSPLPAAALPAAPLQLSDPAPARKALPPVIAAEWVE